MLFVGIGGEGGLQFFVTVVLTFALGLLFQMTLVSSTFSGYTVVAEVFIVGSVMERREGEAINNQKLSLIYLGLYSHKFK